jgi:restriction system protein
MLLFLFILLVLIRIFIIIKELLYKKKINELLKEIRSKEDLLYLNFNDYKSLIIEVLKRYGYKVKSTDACGIDGSGLKLNNTHFAEIWKHGLQQQVDVELAMNFAKCMQRNSIYRGMLITLGDFKLCTKIYCKKNVIECINGDQLLGMFKAVQHAEVILETAK